MDMMLEVGDRDGYGGCSQGGRHFADKEVDNVADMGVDKVANMVLKTDEMYKNSWKQVKYLETDMETDMETEKTPDNYTSTSQVRYIALLPTPLVSQNGHLPLFCAV